MHNNLSLNEQSVASSVLGTFLLQAKVENGMRYIKVPGMPHGAVHAFIRFLYSSWYALKSLLECQQHLIYLMSIGFSLFDSLNFGAVMTKKQWTNLFSICSYCHIAI